MKMYHETPGLGVAAMQDFSANPGKTALIVVDMQFASTHRDFGFQRLLAHLGSEDELAAYLDRVDQVVIPNVRRLQAAFREQRWPVIFLIIGSEREDYRDLDRQRQARIACWQSAGLPVAYARVGEAAKRIRPEVAPVPGETVINKTTASAFNSSPFAGHLTRHGITTLVFASVANNFCVEMTLRDASARGLLCLVVDDACATMSDEAHRRAVDVLRFYARIVTTDEILGEVPACQTR